MHPPETGNAPVKTSRTLEAVSRYRHPVAFYVLATAIPWAMLSPLPGCRDDQIPATSPSAS